MKLYDELYFEITASGEKRDINKFIAFLNSGALDDFFEMDESFLEYDDDFDSCEDDGETSVILVNDDIGIEIEEFETFDFLETICRNARAIDLRGRLYDADDEEYAFVSAKGDSYYLNADNIELNDELDEQAKKDDAEDN
ncbi:MAG: hypothetical protein IJY24_01440 [Clostridia bacterium]|nr:hypothetical protein [Clostridia bacterium]